MTEKDNFEPATTALPGQESTVTKRKREIASKPRAPRTGKALISKAKAALRTLAEAGVSPPPGPINRLLRQRERALIQAVGDPNELQREVIKVAAREGLLLEACDTAILEIRGGIAHRGKRQLHGIVRERAALADAYTRRLQSLGLTPDGDNSSFTAAFATLVQEPETFADVLSKARARAAIGREPHVIDAEAVSPAPEPAPAEPGIPPMPPCGGFGESLPGPGIPGVMRLVHDADAKPALEIADDPAPRAPLVDVGRPPAPPVVTPAPLPTRQRLADDLDHWGWYDRL